MNPPPIDTSKWRAVSASEFAEWLRACNFRREWKNGSQFWYVDIFTGKVIGVETVLDRVVTEQFVPEGLPPISNLADIDPTFSCVMEPGDTWVAGPDGECILEKDARAAYAAAGKPYPWDKPEDKP